MKKLTTILGFALFILVLSANSASAQEQMSEGVYIDTKEHEVYTARQAKKMNFKNESGAALTQMADIPEDFKPTDDLEKMKKEN